MQQLGRGLRLSEEKECLTVLDFIGQANRKYNFEDKFAALLAHATRSVSREIKDGFVSVPKGCYIQLEKKAAKLHTGQYPRILWQYSRIGGSGGFFYRGQRDGSDAGQLLALLSS